MSDFVWRMVRRAIRWQLALASRKVLFSRNLDMQDGRQLRWMKSELEPFFEDVEREAEAMRRFARLEAFAAIGNRLMVEGAIYTASVYRAFLCRDLARQTASAVTADIGWIVYARLLRLASLPFRMASRDPGKRLRGTVSVLLRFPFSAPGPPGYAVRVEQRDDDLLTHFTHCPPQNFVRELIEKTDDKGDLEAFREGWCQYDWPGADIIAGDKKRGHYERRQTLSMGDPVCDMCWKARANEVADGKDHMAR